MAHLQTSSNVSPKYFTDASNKVSFCGLRFCFEGISNALAHEIQARYGCRDSKAVFGPEISIKIKFEPLESKPDSAFTSQDGYEPLLEHEQGKVKVEGPGFEGKIHLKPCIKAYLSSTSPGQFTKTIVYEAFLRIASAYAIFEKGGLFMHSAAVLVNGHAYLFMGRSNAGKTTISRMALAAGHSVLSDDANMIYPDKDGHFVANAVPFAGELGQTGPRDDGPFMVAGVFWLEQAEECDIEQLGVAESISKLMVCAPVLNVDPFRALELISRLERITQKMTVATLQFSRRSTFNEILAKILGLEGARI